MNYKEYHNSIELENIFKLLDLDPVKNLSIKGFIENNKIQLIKRYGNSLFVRGTSDHEWNYFSSGSESEFCELLEGLNEKDKYFASLEDWMIPLLTQHNEAEWMFSTIRYYLKKKLEISESNLLVSRLLKSDPEYIIGHSIYKDFLTVEYLIDRIEKSYSAGIRDNGKLVAWGLTHDDGAIGSLHVLEEYRKKGYGQAVFMFLINQCLKNKKIPFVQVEEKNFPSLNLVKKLGFTKDRKVTWIKLK